MNVFERCSFCQLQAHTPFESNHGNYCSFDCFQRGWEDWRKMYQCRESHATLEEKTP